MEILKIENLWKIYGKEEAKVTALNNVSFSINEGEFVIIIGPSGSGKSTLLHTIAGLEKPSQGRIYFNEHNLYDMRKKQLAIMRRENIGIIYQFYNLIPTLNVKENILLPLKLDKKRVENKKFEELIKFLNLENKLEYLPNQLSGGQQQKTAIARALIINPKLILADEPTGNLDIQSSNEVMSLLKNANKKYKKTIIMITHNLEYTKLADRIIQIEDGKIV